MQSFKLHVLSHYRVSISDNFDCNCLQSFLKNFTCVLIFFKLKENIMQDAKFLCLYLIADRKSKQVIWQQEAISFRIGLIVQID